MRLCAFMKRWITVLISTHELLVVSYASCFTILSSASNENAEGGVYQWPMDHRPEEPQIHGVSCWISRCREACQSRNNEGRCKYKCQPKLQAFTQCVTKCVCLESNVWPERHDGQSIIDCDQVGCQSACRNMKFRGGKCEIKRRHKPQGLQTSAHCHCTDDKQQLPQLSQLS